METGSGHSFHCTVSILCGLLEHVFTTLEGHSNLKISCKYLHLTNWISDSLSTIKSPDAKKHFLLLYLRNRHLFILIILFKTRNRGPEILWSGLMRNLQPYLFLNTCKITLRYCEALTCDQYPGSYIVITGFFALYSLSVGPPLMLHMGDTQRKQSLTSVKWCN